MTDGMKTSEFWLVLVLIIGTFVLIGMGKISGNDVIGIASAALGVGGYSISRGLAKGKSNGNGVKPQ